MRVMLDMRNSIHIHEDDLELYLRGGLELERIPEIESHLIECVICQGNLSKCLGQRVALHQIRGTNSEATQKRAEPRFSTEGEATLQELNPLSMDRHRVTILNISKNGLGILSPKAIFPGTIVQLRIKDSVELGNVRYCSAQGDEGFQIGLRLHGEG